MHNKSKINLFHQFLLKKTPATSLIVFAMSP
jgi:hypothetical protein